MNASKTLLTLTLGAALGSAGLASASFTADAPFAMQALDRGYLVAAADKAKEGKCGEGKCGAKASKAKEGKCGEGKCGGMM